MNESDAKTAIRLWTETIGREQALAIDPDTPTYTGVASVMEGFRRAQVDGITMLADEYWAIHDKIPLAILVLGVRRSRVTDRFIVLVRTEAPIRSLADLRDGTLTRMRDPRSILGAVWLETELLEGHLGLSERFWRRQTTANTVANTVLPVFFKQADACLTTRDAFDTMVELNPQVGRQLRILAESPELVSVVFGFSSGMEPEKLRRVQLAVPAIKNSASGRQILTLFESENVVIAPPSVMESACALLDRHAALMATSAGSPVPVAAEPNPPAKP